MTYLPQLLTLAAVMLLACISPGPNFVAVMAAGLTSRRNGLLIALGITASSVAWAALAMFGLGILLSQMAWCFEVIRLFGAGYLVYLGAKMLWAARKPYPLVSVEDIKTVQSPLRSGLLIGFANPKSVAFFGSLFIEVLPVGAPAWVHVMTMVIVALITAGWFCALALMVSVPRVRSVYAKIRRAIDALMGAVLVALGVRLAVAQ